MISKATPMLVGSTYTIKDNSGRDEVDIDTVLRPLGLAIILALRTTCPATDLFHHCRVGKGSYSFKRYVILS